MKMSSIALDLDFLEMQKSFTVSVPRRRWILPSKLISFEEIARIYGYDHFAN